MKIKGTLRKKFYQILRDFDWELSKCKPCRELDCGTVALAMLRGRQNESFVVQVGACDGQAGDPLYRHLSSGSFRAVLVEPVPLSFKRLSKSYEGIPSVNLCNAAIAQANGTMTMYSVKNEGRWKDSIHAPLWSSFDKSHIRTFGVLDSEIESTDVRTITLATLMAESSTNKIDYLMIDTEGYDGKIVEMALNLESPPKLISFEHVHLSKADRIATYSRLNDHGYSCIHDRMNSLAVCECEQ